MSNLHDQIPDWDPCQGGELRQVVRQARMARRNKDLSRFVGSVGMLVALIAIVAVAAQQFRGLDAHQYGGISCAETKLHLASYRAGNLDAELAAQVKEHLAQCPGCLRVYDRMQALPEDPTASTPGDSTLVTALIGVISSP